LLVVGVVGLDVVVVGVVGLLVVGVVGLDVVVVGVVGLVVVGVVGLDVVVVVGLFAVGAGLDVVGLLAVGAEWVAAGLDGAAALGAALGGGLAGLFLLSAWANHTSEHSMISISAVKRAQFPF
jgi:hypothetical protein